MLILQARSYALFRKNMHAFGRFLMKAFGNVDMSLQRGMLPCTIGKVTTTTWLVTLIYVLFTLMNGL